VEGGEVGGRRGMGRDSQQRTNVANVADVATAGDKTNDKRHT